MITSKQLVSFAEKLIDQKAVYWYGTFYLKCTDSLYKGKKSQYPNHYTAARAPGYKADIKAGKMGVDCIGVIKGAAWTDGGDHAAKYATNGCPDKSANDMFAWCKSKGMKTGKITTLPEVPGLFLHMSGHAGVYIGNGYAIEAKGFAADVVKTKVAGRGWTGWAYLPFVNYGAGQADKPDEPGEMLLYNGCVSDAVQALQIALISLGYGCGKWGADGEFGDDTIAAVIAFQYDHGLPETGVVDEAVYAAIARAMAPEAPDEPDEPDESSEPSEPENDQYVSVTSGNTINVRTAPSTSGAKLGIAYQGDLFDYAGETAANGWHSIVFGSGIGWISGLYTTLGDAPVPPAPTPEPTPETAPPPELQNPVIVDVSQHSALKLTKNDWAKIAKNVDLLILRCGVTRTETKPIGIGIDSEFAYAAKKCIEHRIPFGVFYYGKVKSEAEARKEARKAYETASPYKPLFYVYDVEEERLSNAMVEAWIDEIRKLGAKKVGLYVAHHLYSRFAKAVKKADFRWIPRYGQNTGKYDSRYKPAYPCDLHQYTSVGKVSGFADNTLDVSRLTGTKSLNWFLGKE